MRYSRRQFIGGALGTAVAWPALAVAARQSSDPPPIFRHGVASGDPLTDRVMLWTRVTPRIETAAGTLPVRWIVADDERLQKVVASGAVETSSARDYTVKVDAGGLRPGRTYYYGFDAGGERSAIGRTKTLPQDDVARVRLASISCSNYPAGYFNVYRCVARRDDLDAVVHLGDYIYEFANGVYGDGSGSGRVPMPAGEASTLADYRMRYATYRSDVDLQAAHAAHPFIAVWDDHEIINDWWRDGAAGHRPNRGDWATRLAAGLQAYREWMPVRETGAGTFHLYRSFRFGRLADLLMLDTRSFRDKQAAPRDAATLADPARTLMGKAQEDWLFTGLQRSQSEGTTWRLIGQQTMFSPISPPGVPPQNTDVWDGYPAARARVFDALEKNRLSNVAILTGDIHSSWAFDVPRSPLRGYAGNTGEGSLAVELVTPAISSPPLFASASMRDATSLLQLVAPHLKFVEGEHRGYVLLDLTKARLHSEWYHVPAVDTRSDAESRFAAYVSEAGSSRLSKA
ncbi:MAG TPA: alkaline phosphatase D family protein [Vicinamibacterales bacterium]|jgi:alkaline phosphatase D|nr:alkaline phosphatase D family protein [Vicinamibacterales bacterium]